MRKVAIFTTFYEVDSGYSLVSVVETQLKMLLDLGYDPIVLVDERFKSQNTLKDLWQPHTLDIRPVIPRLDTQDPDRMQKTQEVLGRELEGVDVVLTHDIILHSFYQEYDQAMRRAAGDRVWLHWIHSRPSRKYTPPPGYIIYPNDSEKPLVVNCYGLQGQEYRVKVDRSSHSIDPLEVWDYDPLTRDLVRASDFLGGDFSLIYPRGGDPGKQTEKILYLMAGIKGSGYDPRLLIVDWQSQGQKFQTYMDRMETLANELGVRVDVTSRLDDRCSQGIPRRVVQELLDLSNIYIHASSGETYCLVAHEAMLRGNLVVLNHDTPPMRELFGQGAIYMDFGSATVSRTYDPDEQTFWADEARRLLAEYQGNRVLVAQSQARRAWSPQTLAKEFESLLYLENPGE